MGVFKETLKLTPAHFFICQVNNNNPFLLFLSFRHDLRWVKLL
jgi:hypothetical protein